MSHLTSGKEGTSVRHRTGDREYLENKVRDTGFQCATNVLQYIGQQRVIFHLNCSCM